MELDWGVYLESIIIKKILETHLHVCDAKDFSKLGWVESTDQFDRLKVTSIRAME